MILTNDIAKFLIGQVYLLCRIFRCDFILSCFLATLVDRFSSRNLWTGRWRKTLTWKMTSMRTKPFMLFLYQTDFFLQITFSD